MDETRQPTEADAPLLKGLHWCVVAEGELPPGFFPLRLVLQPGGTTIELTRPDTLLGRHSAADVRLPLPDVSRRHCRCLFAEGNWRIVDLNSLNGLWVNDEHVQQAILQQGDVLRLGGFTFSVELLDTKTEVVSEDSVVRAIYKALPPPDHEAIQRRRAS